MTAMPDRHPSFFFCFHSKHNRPGRASADIHINKPDFIMAIRESEGGGIPKDIISSEDVTHDETAPGLESSEDGSHSDTSGSGNEEEQSKNEEDSMKKNLLILDVQVDKKNPPSSDKTKEEPAPAAVEQEPDDALLLSDLATNEKWILKSHPPVNGTFVAERDMELVADPLHLHLDQLQTDEVLVRVDILAIDPFLRTMIDAGEIGTVKINDPIQAMGVGTVLKCHKDADDAGVEHEFTEGSVVVGLMTAAKYAVVKSSILQEKVAFARPSAALGILGSVGETAYIGTFIAPSKSPQKGETVVVSDAAGSVGCIVCQIAKFLGAKVVGVIGAGVGCGAGAGEEKKRFLMEQLKLDGLVDCNDTASTEQKTTSQQLEEACPNGIDFVFDSVGGDILNEVLNHINTKARVVICDAISQYQSLATIQGPSNYLKLVEKSASLHGFNAMDYPEHSFAATTYLGWNYMRDNFIFPQRIETGIDMFAASMERYFLHGHCGRLLLQVSYQFETSEFSDEDAEPKKVEIDVPAQDVIDLDEEPERKEEEQSETGGSLNTSSSSC